MNPRIREISKLIASMLLLMFIVAAGIGTVTLIIAVSSPWIGAIMIPVFALAMLLVILAADSI
jgi:TRAP-type C4-dicarboxylate transport system permease small subunit